MQTESSVWAARFCDRDPATRQQWRCRSGSIRYPTHTAEKRSDMTRSFLKILTVVYGMTTGILQHMMTSRGSSWTKRSRSDTASKNSPQKCFTFMKCNQRNYVGHTRAGFWTWGRRSREYWRWTPYLPVMAFRLFCAAEKN